MSDNAGKNIWKEPLRVRHSELKRLNQESDYKSQCPSCEHGILLVQRDQQSRKIVREDRCIRCGQSFIYIDNEIAGEKLLSENPLN
jgi:predicted RNA-binding Zn-ribbon protein involved in translation (DUF1610 family)